MIEPRGNRFTRYFPLLLEALRATDPTPMRPAAVRAWIRSNMDVAVEDLTRFIKKGENEGKQSIFENDVYWAKFYLAKAGLVGAQKRGLWGLTPEGRGTHLTREDAEALCVRVRAANRRDSSTDEQEVPAPGSDDADEDQKESFWFVGAVWHKTDDQITRFLKEDIWQNGDNLPTAPPGRGAEHDRDLVRRMKPGDRIAI